MTRTLPFAILLFAGALAASADTFTVSREDDGPGTGTLRWAIEGANAAPGTDSIAILTPVKTIAVAAPLPPITDALKLQLQTPVTIDGTSAGAGDGLVLNADHIELRNVTVQNFNGDGFVVHGSFNVLELLIARHDANGIRIEGSQNTIAGGTFEGNRAAGLWLTASATGNTIGRYIPPCQILCPITAAGNVMKGNDGEGILVDSNTNTLDANLASHNGGHGIVVHGAATALRHTESSYNSGDGLHLYAVVDVDDSMTGTCNGGKLIAGDGIPLQPAPRVTMAVDDLTAVTVFGDLTAAADTKYVVQTLSASNACGPEQPTYRIGSTTVTTDAHGYAAFRVLAGRYQDVYIGALDRVAAIAHLASHPSGISELSPLVNSTLNTNHRADLAVSTTGPTVVTVGSDVTFDTVVINNGPAAIYNTGTIDIPALPGATLVRVTMEKGTCYLGGLNWCLLDPFAPGDMAVIHHTLRFSTPGLYTYSATARLYSGGDVDPNAGNNQGQVNVLVESIKTSRRRAVVH